MKKGNRLGEAKDSVSMSEPEVTTHVTVDAPTFSHTIFAVSALVGAVQSLLLLHYVWVLAQVQWELEVSILTLPMRCFLNLAVAPARLFARLAPGRSILR